MSSEILELDGLECEEAMSLVRSTVRRNGGSAFRLSSASYPFHLLLTQWADNAGRTLTPATKPIHGQLWVLTVEGKRP